MEKRVWTMPQAAVEQFEMSQYIAACWNISCSVDVTGCGYAEDNGVPGLQTSYDVYDHNTNLAEGEQAWVEDTEYVCGGRSCSSAGNTVMHTVSGINASAPYANGWWLPSGNTHGAAATQAFYFVYDTGLENTSIYHFSELDDVVWEKNPNAS